MTATGMRFRPASPHRLAEALGLPSPTEEQAAVVTADPGEPTLVVAGAGSGKTETMAARVVWLVANGFVSPEGVLGLTFTRKAAQQLAERIRLRLRRLAGSGILDELDPTGGRRAAVLAEEPTVLTYHAYAGRLVADHALRLPADPGARLLTETAAWQLAHRVTSGWDGDLDLDGKIPRTVTGWLLALSGQLAEHLVEPGELDAFCSGLGRRLSSAEPSPRQRKPVHSDLQPVLDAQLRRCAMLPLVERYAELKRAAGVLDFGDQMSIAARLAQDHPEVGEAERARYQAVLLDEYQDTGHAQRILLRSLFGGNPVPGRRNLAVTAVGDPCQSIYGWRGASAANLPRFTTDFPDRDGEPAPTLGLLTSFRNPPEVLEVANRASAELRRGAVPVGELRARDGAGVGDVRVAVFPDIRAEIAWIADSVAQRWHAAVADSGVPATAAVLVRRRADMGPLASALRGRDVPVEVVGLGGLLDTPEVRDLVSALRLLVDPLAGTAAVRLLTGARWRIGAADLVALWQRARELVAQPDAPRKPEGQAATEAQRVLASLPDDLPGELTDQPGLVDALDAPGDPERYSAAGFARVQALGTELRALRGRVTQTLTDLVADVERTLLLDTETLVRPGPEGRAHLDAFADVVTDFVAANPTAGLPMLLEYLATAEDAEDGLEPGEVEVAPDRVQILTVHAAKGLEWEIVAVPHLVEKIFPAAKKSSSWLRNPTELPAALRGDSIDLPGLTLPPDGDQKDLADVLGQHEEAFDTRRLDEERRLFYVAVTRAERTLLASAHRWGETGEKPREVSAFLDVVCSAGAEVEHWADEPEEGASHPFQTETRQTTWPVDPFGERRDHVTDGARMVFEAIAGAGPDQLPLDSEGWDEEIDVLLAERDARRREEQVTLPGHLSVSQLVELARDPGALASRLRRPMPVRPNPLARRGTAFHSWLEHRFEATRLIDVDELPGAADGAGAPDSELTALQEAFLRSDWANRQPTDVEVPFETVVDGIGVRGRMDAVFSDGPLDRADGGWTVVDWKTGEPPRDDEAMQAASVQLAAYRLAWADLTGAPLDRVRAAFHYVRYDRTIQPTDLLDEHGLRDLLRGVPTTTA